ncbi:carbohydrate ABC transporter substrate-binding protein (CUT1 family) [Kribbella voronezhensis]|uniref:Carbohydrate ABC transporter substrate-binding protein (CUT1 family) n=1 Tax=Kribbella voronezhensis TaxID=2512212 RepID=A0A4R7SVM9_9ACTN|nr:ABC transporter substrate-binding protein [Kribbella voronezhensis]TDU83372.1 carbohydrate ABC transporter substrate-binding protein (CUT1 family) [Kribbella voronezhensis]
MIGNRIAAALAGVTALSLALAGCGDSGNKSSSSGQSVTSLSILDYYNNDPDKALVQKGLDSCASKLSITIKRETVPGDTLIAKVLQQASSKTLPDVLMLDNPDVQQIAATGALAPLNDLGLNADGVIQGMVDATSYQGKLYGLAPVTNTIALFYNKTMLADAGVQPPKTWDELKAAAKKLTKPGRYGMAFNANATYEGSWQFLPAMWTNGGDETDLKSPQVAEALQLWVDLVKSGSASKSVINWTQGDVKDQFVAGKAAMMVNGPWQIPALAKAPNVKWDVVTFPLNKPDQTPVAPLGGEAWTVPLNKDQAKQQKAADFVKCLNSDENELAWAKARFTLPTKTALLDQYAQEVPSMKAFAEQVKTARARTGKLGDKWPDAAKVIYQAIQLALTGKASAQDAFKQASG